MAKFSASASSTLSKELKDYNVFKQEFISKLNWTKRKWSLVGQLNSELYKSIKNGKYWFSKLRETNVENAFTFMLYKEGLQFKPNVVDVLREFKLRCGLEGLEGFSETQNKNFLVFQFKGEEYKQKAEDTFIKVKDYIVISSEWFKQNEKFDVEIQWLPITIEIEKIKILMEEYLHIEWINHKYINLDGKDIVKTGRIIGKAKLKGGINLSQIPYYLKIDGYIGYILLTKRKKICFNCDEVGHVRANCKLVFCLKCKKKINKAHICIKAEKEGGIQMKSELVENNSKILLNKSKNSQINREQESCKPEKSVISIPVVKKTNKDIKVSEEKISNAVLINKDSVDHQSLNMQCKKEEILNKEVSASLADWDLKVRDLEKITAKSLEIMMESSEKMESDNNFLFDTSPLLSDLSENMSDDAGGFNVWMNDQTIEQKHDKHGNLSKQILKGVKDSGKNKIRTKKKVKKK